jgi:hypothetical protein
MKKNITLSADEEAIRKARERALREHTTLNEVFRKWLRQYAQLGNKRRNFSELMDALKYAKPGRQFTRDEMNER